MMRGFLACVLSCATMAQAAEAEVPAEIGLQFYQAIALTVILSQECPGYMLSQIRTPRVQAAIDEIKSHGLTKADVRDQFVARGQSAEQILYLGFQNAGAKFESFAILQGQFCPFVPLLDQSDTLEGDLIMRIPES